MCIYQELKWDNHIDSKAQQTQYFLRQLKKLNLPQELLKQFCHHRDCPVLIYHCLVWFSYTKTDIRRLQRTVRTTERVIGGSLPNLQELYTSREWKRDKKVTLDPSHPAHYLFELLPSGRHYRALSTKTTRQKNSFTPRPYPTWTTYNTPHCTSFNNSSNLNPYIGYMHIHSSVYGHFLFCIFIFITIVIHNYSLFSLLIVFFITLIICCLHYVCSFCTGSS